MDNRRWILPIILAIALVATGVWGYRQYQEKENYSVMLNNQYQRMFFDMKGHVETVQTSLSKALLSESKDQNILLFSQIAQQALYAQEKLSQLPIKHNNLSKTQKFLNQVGDYSLAMVQEHLDGNPLSSKQRDTLTQLQNYTGMLTTELSEAFDTLRNGNMMTFMAREKENLKEANEDMLDTNLINFQEEMTEYPELIYDGPFSDQTLNAKPKALGNKKVDQEEAQRIAEEFIGKKKAGNFEAFESGDDMDSAANIPSYSFSVVPENEGQEAGIYLGVSKTGGKVVWMENPRSVNKINLSEKQAQTHALKFLEEHGYSNMEPNYTLKYDGKVLFNMAYQEEDVTIYPDLVKVKIALDNGEVVGFDASGYLKTHYDRDIPEPKVTQEEARDKVRLDFDIENVRLTIIPKNGLKEVLCYEFKGKYKGSDFIVYINALNGKEEKILRVIKDENGTLMI